MGPATRTTLALTAALAAVALVPARAPAADDLPHPDIDYIAGQLAFMSSNYLMRYSGFDGPPGDLDPAHGNQPPTVNGWQEFFQHWKDQLRDGRVLGSFADPGSISDHPFDIHVFVDQSPQPPFQGDVPILTIPGASCPGQNTLVASHPDSTPALNTGNGSTYDDTSGVTMGMGETKGMAAWWQRSGTWPDRTYRLGLFDAEEVGLDGSYYYAANLIPQGNTGQYVLVANMDQNGMEYPAYPLGRTNTTYNPGPWHTNINASPIKDFSLPDYNDGKDPPGPNAAIAGNLANIQHFRAALADSVRQAFLDQGAEYGNKVPLFDGSTAKVYDPADIPGKSPVQDDTLGRTDQVPFVAQGIPGFGVLGAYDTEPNQNPAARLGPLSPLGDGSLVSVPQQAGYDTEPTQTPAARLGPLSPLGDGSLVSVPQQAGYDTPRDNIAHFNAMTGGKLTPDKIEQAGRQALELPATWTTFLLSRPEYSGAAPRPTAPIAFFDAFPNAPKPGDKIAFDAGASVDPVGRGLQYLWDFGDGATATGPMPVHAYGAVGWYTPTLVVRDAEGNQVGYRQAVKIGDTKDPAPDTDPCGSISTQQTTQVAEQVASANPGVVAAQRGPVACAASVGFRRVRARPTARGLRFSIARAQRRPFSVSIFEASRGRRAIANRGVFHAQGLAGSFTWSPRGALRDGAYFARVGMQLPGGRPDVRRVTLR